MPLKAKFSDENLAIWRKKLTGRHNNLTCDDRQKNWYGGIVPPSLLR